MSLLGHKKAGGVLEFFNIRAYGILMNERGEVLVSDEREYDQEFTKFPGGGVELGEGVRDALIREFKEECGIDVAPVKQIYTTENFIHSTFNNSQLIAVYYLVRAVREEDLQRIPIEPLPPVVQPAQVFRWIPQHEFRADLLTFQVDQEGWLHFEASHKI